MLAFYHEKLHSDLTAKRRNLDALAKRFSRNHQCGQSQRQERRDRMGDDPEVDQPRPGATQGSHRCLDEVHQVGPAGDPVFHGKSQGPPVRDFLR